MPPMVSVIVPTYNRPEMLAECLESINGQTYQDLEVVVINDGGRDVGDIVSACNKRKNIRYLNQPTNKGLAAARNSGIRAAKGKYIAYLDDDDIYYPDHIETLVGFLEESQYMVAYTDACRAVQKKGDGGYVVEKRDIPYSMDFDRDRLLISNYIPVLCIMHDISCIDKSGYFDEGLSSHEDWDLWIRLSRMFEFGHVGKTTCEFRWRHDATTMSSQRREDFLRTLGIIHERYRDFTKERAGIRKAQSRFIKKQRALLRIWLCLTGLETWAGVDLTFVRKILV
jgi:glycosyltransferase involved in cell wall biosynthesis